MKISKWVDMGQEVDIDIDAADIRCALQEAFNNITADGPGHPEITRTLNLMAQFINAISDEQISLLSSVQRETIDGFFGRAIERFSVASTQTKGGQ